MGSCKINAPAMGVQARSEANALLQNCEPGLGPVVLQNRIDLAYAIDGERSSYPFSSH
jgi:hypothetical protein